MIWRTWTILGIVIVVGAWLLAIPYSPAPSVGVGTVIDTYRAMGMVPAPGQTRFSEALGHDVFEVPERDGAELKKATAAMASIAPDAGAMPGMDMKPGDQGSMQAMPGMTEKAEPGAEAMKSMPGMTEKAEPGAEAMKSMPGMAEKAEHGAETMQPMPGMDMKAGEHADEGMKAMPGEMGAPAEEGEGHGRGSMADGLTILAFGAKEVAAVRRTHKIAATHTINMREWGFEQGMVMARPGEILHLVVKNTGTIPHEFMLMNPAGMAAVDYRLRRADWNLLEHEATFEVPGVLPGDGFEMVVQIHKPGVWMYMCMFPYHMQLGMMGMLMTPDMMGKMPAMKM